MNAMTNPTTTRPLCATIIVCTLLLLAGMFAIRSGARRNSLETRLQSLQTEMRTVERLYRYESSDWLRSTSTLLQEIASIHLDMGNMKQYTWARDEAKTRNDAWMKGIKEDTERIMEETRNATR